jgi:hypothetical protein
VVVVVKRQISKCRLTDVVDPKCSKVQPIGSCIIVAYSCRSMLPRKIVVLRFTLEVFRTDPSIHVPELLSSDGGGPFTFFDIS